MQHYVYEHYIPNEPVPFYVGKGHGNRAYQRGNRNKWWKHIVEKHGFEVKIILENLSEDEANELEKHLIAQYGRRDIGTGILVNMTDGGEGAVGIKRPPITPELRELRRQLSTGRKHSEESKQKRSEKIKERIATADGDDHLRLIQRMGNSEESRQKKSETHKKFWSTEEGKRIKHEAVKRGWVTRKNNKLNTKH